MAKNKQPGPVDTKTMLMALGAAVVIIAIMLFLPNQVKRLRGIDTSPKPEISATETELICNLGTQLKTDYRSLCVINAIPEGYRLDKLVPGISDEKLCYLRYVPVDPSRAAAQKYTVSPESGTAAALAKSTPAEIDAVSAEHIYDSGILEAAVGSVTAQYFEQRYAVSAGENGVKQYCQSITLYLPSGYGERCIGITAQNSGSDESCFRESADLVSLVLDIAEGITVTAAY